MNLKNVWARTMMRADSALTRAEPDAPPNLVSGSDDALLSGLRSSAPKDPEALTFNEQLRGAL